MKRVFLCPSYAGSNLKFAIQTFRDMRPVYKKLFSSKFIIPIVGLPSNEVITLDMAGKVWGVLTFFPRVT